jgi:nicotinate-nucleotide adenylyltransferase
MPDLWFGGSFNPIHHAHLICARAVAEQAGYKRVVLVPSAISPHKINDSTMASSADRLEMCRLATANIAGFDVSDIEITLPTPSFTLQTARELRRRGHDKIHWLIGGDMLLYLPQWRQPLDLLAEVHFIVMARPGSNIDWSALPPEYRHLRDNVVEAPQIDISATDIRRRVVAGLGIDFLTPPAVCDYIRNHGLYR